MITRAFLLAIAFAGCAGNDPAPATSEQTEVAAPRKKEEPPVPADQPITIASMAEAAAAVGKQVRVEGDAEDAKLAAVVIGEHLMIYCLGRHAWPSDLVRQRVVVTGTLEYTEQFASKVGPGGMHSAGTEGGVYAIRDCMAELAAP